LIWQLDKRGMPLTVRGKLKTSFGTVFERSGYPYPPRGFPLHEIDPAGYFHASQQRKDYPISRPQGIEKFA